MTNHSVLNALYYLSLSAVFYPMVQRIGLSKCISIILVLLFVSGILILFFKPIPPLLENIVFSKAFYDDKGHLLRLTLSPDDKFRLYTPLKDISPELIDATLLQEDQYFRSHYGVNPWAMLKAFEQTYLVKSRKIGASTITMQVARLRYGMHSKKIGGKLEQIIKAFQIEMHYNKDEILEAYFNLAPYGANIEGIGAASLIYFNTSAKTLNLPEALTLSVIPQNPNKRRPDNPDLKTIRDKLFQRWLEKHPQDRAKKALFSLPLTMQNIASQPFKAPHFINTLMTTTKASNSVQTTLDARLQTLVETIVKRYIDRKKSLGVYNAAVLLVDTRDMNVKALMGSADFFNKGIAGQINGTQTKRSPGSALKPFIYALAIDQGLIHPSTVLKDVPRSFNGYNPENFDYDFMGPIKAKDALILSRNVPAVYLSSQLSNPSLYQLLEKAQVAHLKPESVYGLSINLGGAEITLHELLGLYAMLVNDGVWYPLCHTRPCSKNKGVRLLSPEASFLILDILKETARGDLSYKTTSSFPIAWKTGTSSGFRDAWTLGAFGPYVLGVWIGNFDNSPNPAFVGKEIAAPLFFELVEAIKQERGPMPSLEKNPQSLHLERIPICKASGMIPTRYCVDTELTWFIPGKSPIKTDIIFKEVAINAKTRLRTCHIDSNTRFEIYEFWPSDLLSIFKKAGIQRKSPPFFEPDCALSSASGMSPQITSPQSGVSYVIRPDSKENNTIPFTAITDAGIEYLYWFVNDSYVAKTKVDEAYLWPAKPGNYTVRVLDGQGLSDAQHVNIRLE